MTRSAHNDNHRKPVPGPETIKPDPDQSPEDTAYAEHLFIATPEDVKPVEEG